MRKSSDLESLVFRKLSEGGSNKSVAIALGLSEWQVRTIRRKSDTHKVLKKTYNEVRLKTVKVKKSGIKKAIILSDIHIPEHDQTALAIALAYMGDVKPDVIVLNGDIIDCINTSRFPKDPHRIETFADELNETRSFLRLVADQHPKARKYYTQGNHECFDNTTEVATSKGWKLFSDLCEDDEVASFNTITQNIEYGKPLSIISKQYAGDMISITSQSTDLLITPNHRLITKPSTITSKPWSIEKFSDMKMSHGKRLVIPASGSSAALDDPSILDDELRISGWLITDGHIGRQKSNKGIPHNIMLYQRTSKVHLIIDILNRLGWAFTHRVRDRDIKAIQGKLLKKKPEPSNEIRLLRSCKSRAYQLVQSKQRLPEWVFNLSNRQFTVFLESMIDGDGSRHPSCPTSSWMLYGKEPLMSDVQRACLQYGYRTSLTEYRPGCFRLSITKANITTIDKITEHITNLPYNGMVYCVTTRNDTVVVRRNGKISITGNCRVEKYLFDRAPELSSLPELSIDSLLHLQDMGYTFMSDTEKVKLGRLEVFHGEIVRKDSGASARGHMNKRGGSVLIGHIHKLGCTYRTDRWGTHIAAENGHLSRPDPDYVVDPDWQQGFTEVHFTDKGDFCVRQHHILDGRLIVDGKIYEV